MQIISRVALGAALLDARPGDEVPFSAPCGPRRVQVVMVE